MREVRLESPDDEHEFHFELRIKVGDDVKRGDIIAIVETDKASMEMDADEAMRILRITPTRRDYVLEVE